MNPIEIILKKRNGQRLSDDEIRAFITGYVDGSITDYQAAAWAMAIYFRGMDDAETTVLTQAMAESGDQLDLHDAVPPGSIIVDKHSSGGIGDKTTLAVGPIVAACGLPVGKMSGRGLGFTGGTIDKLESISGWSPDLSEERFRKQLREVGLVVAGQTANLAPADKKLYALRDVTGTVDSMPLIAGSIMSKKLAAGADAIVLDVKCGRGAFIETLEEAKTLAGLMVAIGSRAGRQMTALITQMEQPLGVAVGNALEVKEAIDTLQGNGPVDFQELVEVVAAEMLLLEGKEGHTKEVEAKQAIKEVINSGAALAKFREFVVAQGGDARMVDDPSTLPQAPVIVEVQAQEAGLIQQIEAREIGLIAMALGGGRQKKGDPIDHRVGVMSLVKVGDQVAAGDLLCVIHAASEAAAADAKVRALAAYKIGAGSIAALPIIYERISQTI